MLGNKNVVPLENGTRVRNYTQQYPRATWNGTGYIIDHVWYGAWLEYVVRLDEPWPLPNSDLVREWPASMTVPVQ